jgi:hypothetical protein
MRWKVAVVVVSGAVLFGGHIRAAKLAGAQDVPSGERQLGQSYIEPAYNADTGNILYLLTPLGAPFPSKANHHAVSPLYLVVYPNSAGASVGTMNCMHFGGDNCPDHGPGIAALAASVFPGVYGAPDGSGVWGHDHIVDPPGAPDWNVAWQVHVILFNNLDSANTHVTTDSQVDDLVNKTHEAIEIVTPIVFNCNIVSASTYQHATPLPPQ